MKFLSSLLKPSLGAGKRESIHRLLQVVRERYVFAGALLLACLLVAVLLFDGLVFYVYVVRERETAAGNERSIKLSEDLVRDTMRLVDERQRKFDAILENLSPAVLVASSTTTER